MYPIYFHYFFDYISIPDTRRCAIISATHQDIPQVRNSVACAPGKLAHVAGWQKAIVGDNVASTMRNSSAPSATSVGFLLSSPSDDAICRRTVATELSANFSPPFSGPTALFSRFLSSPTFDLKKHICGWCICVEDKEKKKKMLREQFCYRDKNWGKGNI